jgi:hypothetical protein
VWCSTKRFAPPELWIVWSSRGVSSLDGEQHVAAFHPHHIFCPIICNDKVSLTESVGHVGLTVWLRDPSRTFVLPHARTLFRLVATSVRQNKHRSCCYSPAVSPHPLLRMRTRRRARVCSCRPTSVAIDVRTVPTADGTHSGRYPRRTAPTADGVCIGAAWNWEGHRTV